MVRRLARVLTSPRTSVAARRRLRRGRGGGERQVRVVQAVLLGRGAHDALADRRAGAERDADLDAGGVAGLARFSKIMPTDYRRILDIQDKALADGRDPIEAVMEEMSRG